MSPKEVAIFCPSRNMVMRHLHENDKVERSGTFTKLTTGLWCLLAITDMKAYALGKQIYLFSSRNNCFPVPKQRTEMLKPIFDDYRLLSERKRGGNIKGEVAVVNQLIILA